MYMMQNIFDPLVLIVILGSFAVLVAKWLVTQKLLVLQQNGFKFWTPGHQQTKQGIIVTLQCYQFLFVFLFFFYHSMLLSQGGLLLENGMQLKKASHRASRVEIWDSGLLVDEMGATSDLVVFKVILGSISALESLKNGLCSKTDWPQGERVKRIEVFELGCQ